MQVNCKRFDRTLEKHEEFLVLPPRSSKGKVRKKKTSSVVHNDMKGEEVFAT